MKHHYKFYYTNLVGTPIETTQSIVADNPIDGLNQFHKLLQLTDSKLVTTGVVIRPKLTPTQYKITRLTHVYPSLTEKGRFIEAVVNLPNSANPDVNPKPDSVPVQTMEMPLNDARKVNP